jgi:exodeoxyribonuclease VII large subunit
LVREHHLRQESLSARLASATRQSLARAGHRLALAQRGLHSASPLAPLERGFAIVTTMEGKAITDSQQVEFGEQIEARLGKGRIRAIVTDKE